MTLRSGPFFGPRGSIDWSDGKPMQIIVRDNNVDQALRALKKKLQREGAYREMKLRRHYEKPSEKSAREKAAAVLPAPKPERKRAESERVRYGTLFAMSLSSCIVSFRQAGNNHCSYRTEHWRGA